MYNTFYRDLKRKRKRKLLKIAKKCGKRNAKLWKTQKVRNTQKCGKRKIAENKKVRKTQYRVNLITA